MQRIFPVTEETCREHCGKPVLMFLVDGTELQGVLSRVDGSKLILNEPGEMADTKQSSVKARKKVKTKAKSRKKRSVKNAALSTATETAVDPLFQGPPPMGYGFAVPLAFEMNSVAALFVLV